MKILCSFSVILENIGGLEFQRRSKRNKLVVVEASLKRSTQLVLRKCIKFRPKFTKIQKKSNFETFMQFLCNFGKPWWLRISKTFNKEQIDCREGFFRKKTKFCNEKITLNLRQKMTITSKCTNFSRFHATFVKLLKISWIRTLNTFNHE